MPIANDERPDVDVSRLLAGAAKAIRNIRFCWLVTAAQDGGSRQRPMERLPIDAGEDEWTIRFLTDGRSGKAADIRRAGRVAVIFQHAPDDAFATLIGKATLCESASEVRTRWKGAYDAVFPSEADRANAAFVKVDIARMELWIRGVTPEPFGMRTTILERDAGHGWRVTSQ
jgi:general stress protein 26